MVVRVVFGLDNHSPPRGENAAVDVQFVGLKEEASEDGEDGQIVAIREMDNSGIWGHGLVRKFCLN